MDALEQMDLNVWAAKAFETMMNGLGLDEGVRSITLLDDGFGYIGEYGCMVCVVIVDEDAVYEFTEDAMMDYLDFTFTRDDAIQAFAEGRGTRYDSIEHMGAVFREQMELYYEDDLKAA